MTNGLEFLGESGLSAQEALVNSEEDQMKYVKIAETYTFEVAQGYSYWIVLDTPNRCSFTHDQLLGIRELAGFSESH